METLRIAFVTDKSGPYFEGGYERRVWELARRLARRSHDVTIYTSLAMPTERIDDVRFVRLIPSMSHVGSTESRSFTNGLAYSLRLLLPPKFDATPDVLLIEAIPYAHLITMSAWARTTPAKKLVSVDEAWSNYNYGGPRVGPVVRRVIKECIRTSHSWADQILSVSSATAKSLFMEYGVGSSTLVPNGVDLQLIEGFSGSGRLIADIDFITVGRMVDVKRHRDFLGALRLLKEEFDWDGQAVIIGDGPLKSATASLIAAFQLEKNVRLLGRVDDSLKLLMMKRSRAFVLNSEREGFSISALEAMACGLPVIVARPESTDVFGVFDFMSEGVNGLTFPVGDVRQEALAMTRLLTDVSLRARLAQNARETAARYDWGRAVDQLERVMRL